MYKVIVLYSLFTMNLASLALEVTIEQGTLGGLVSADGTIFEYMGIPYASVNSSNRFQAPLPAPSWEGVLNATVDYYCPQINEAFGTEETEDCLKANVYVPAITNTTLPVMLWIHGGGFDSNNAGKTMFGPAFLVKHDIILVTINYRLGVLGFMCLGIKEAPGNAALKDQLAALKWVKKNIAAFGGDPDNITIFGESAGGVSVALLLASETTEGLYKRAIVQSGSALSAWTVNRDPVWTASLLAKTLGHDTKEPHELYKIFSNLHYKDLITPNVSIPNSGYFGIPLLYAPCVEKSIPGVEPILTDLPYNILSKKHKDIPIIYGTTSMEGINFIDFDANYFDGMNYNYLFGQDLEFPSEEEKADVDKTVKKFYFDNERISMDTRMSVAEVYTNLFFEVPTILEAKMLLENNEAPIYNYVFNYTGARDFLRFAARFENETGACHGDDIFYLFDAMLIPFPVNAQDQIMIDRFTKMWTNFAKYGDPTPASDTDLPARWTPSGKDEVTFLYIDDELRMGAMPNPEAYQLWSDIYAKYRNTNAPTFNTATSLVTFNMFCVITIIYLCNEVLSILK